MNKLNSLLKEYDLLHKKEEFVKEFKTSIGIKKILSNNENEIPVGSSKLGGLPDLPQNLSFPTYSNGYLTFLAQFNLEEVRPYDKDKLLPDKGILYIFYNVVDQPWGFDKNDKDGYKVLYFNGEINELIRTPYPITTDEYFPLKYFKVEFRNLFTLSEDLDDVDLNDEESDNYFEFRSELMQLNEDENEDESNPIHYMLGEPFNIQNDVFEEIAYYDNNEKFEWSSREIRRQSNNLVLLFQMDSDDDLEVMWGDSGILYFCINENDLLNKKFDQTKFILQCY